MGLMGTRVIHMGLMGTSYTYGVNGNQMDGWTDRWDGRKKGGREEGK
jgi:hypothetical protein